MYAIGLNVVRRDELARPVLCAAVLVSLAVWTGFASWAYDAPRRRTLPLFTADLAVAVLAVLSTPLVQSEAMLERHAATVPSFWVMTPVLAWAVGRHWAEAVAAAVAVSLADIAVRTELTGGTWGNLFLLLLAAGVVGWSAARLREAAEARAEAERRAAVLAERARLARVVHDGVLQVLALVQRTGAEAGGRMTELARLAAEQESALRALVRTDARMAEDLGVDLHPGSGSGAGRRSVVEASPPADLLALLEASASASISVTGPGRPVLLAPEVAHEVAAAVRACLDNVRRHVGEDAGAWVLLEDLGDRVVVSIRDDGPGIPPGRLQEARHQGRLGVAESIQGRLAALGGQARLVGGPGEGTEWELTVPRGAPRP